MTHDDSPIIIVMDIKRHSITNNISSPPFMRIHCPTDIVPRKLRSYIAGNVSLDSRLRVLILPGITQTAVICMIGTALKPSKWRPLTLASRIHRMTHAPHQQEIRICQNSGCLNKDLAEAITMGAKECLACQTSGLPRPATKTSISHVYQTLNKDVQMDITYCNIKCNQVPVLYMVDSGTSYSEGA